MRTLRWAVLVGVAVPSLVFAWGPDGHRIVADIAGRHLTPEAQVQISRLLTPQTLTDVAPWADRVRNKPQYRWTSSLHYANVAPDAETFDYRRDCPEGNCVVGAIVRFTGVLRDPQATDAQKTEALKFLVHFVADLHQPMHVSRARDRGGNDVVVEFFNNRTNLHKVWDNMILERTKKPWQVYANELDGRITQEQRKAWATLDPSAWAAESWRLAVSNAYVVPKDGQLGQPYLDTNLPVAERQLQTAGVRLAALLNAIFGDGNGLATLTAIAASQPATSAPSATQSAPATTTAPADERPTATAPVTTAPSATVPGTSNPCP
jgi:hypothetical protein